MPKLDLILQGYTLATDQGSVAFCGVTLIEGSRRILVDAAHTGRRTQLLAALQERGLTPADIDVLVLTHAHWDHMLNVDLFKSAEVLIHPRERAYAKAPHEEDWATPSYTGLILEQMKLREVQEGDEIDDGVRVLDTPGHSPGSVSLVVQTDDGPAIVCGDALPNARTALQGSPYLVFYSEEAARRSAAKITSAGRFLYPGHDRPFELLSGSVRYLRPTSLQIQALIDPSESDAGLSIGSIPPAAVRRFAQARMSSAID
jgi:glyoxylase-like metal-dependent hydrolase (beta-lactamase superfamily II)